MEGELTAHIGDGSRGWKEEEDLWEELMHVHLSCWSDGLRASGSSSSKSGEVSVTCLSSPRDFLSEGLLLEDLASKDLLLVAFGLKSYYQISLI